MILASCSIKNFIKFLSSVYFVFNLPCSSCSSIHGNMAVWGLYTLATLLVSRLWFEHICACICINNITATGTYPQVSKIVWITCVHMTFPTGYCLRDKIIKYSQKSPDTLHLVCSWLPCSLLLEVHIIPCPYFSSQLCVTSCFTCGRSTEWASLI